MVDTLFCKDDEHNMAHTPETEAGHAGPSEIQLRAF